MRIQDSLNCDLCTQGSSDCDALNHIKSELQSVEHPLHDAVHLAIPLGDSQFDLAVEQTSIRQIGDQFTDLTNSRLSSCDPLFAAEFGRSFPETAFRALTQMRGRYNKVASSVYKSKNLRRIHWFETQNKRIGNLLEMYRQQCITLAPMPIYVKQQKT
jgi:hypothetical protein